MSRRPRLHDCDVLMIVTSIDGVHQHGAPTLKELRSPSGSSPRRLTTKIYALVEGRGRPVKLQLTAGEKCDIACADGLIADLPKAPCC